jgi:hypothetical protein
VIGLLDPALFLPRPDQEVEHDLSLVIQTCREHAIQLVQLDEYWRDLWTDFARPLERQLGPSARRALQELRKRAESSTRHVPALAAGAGSPWWAGFSQLFGHQALGVFWEEKLARATLRAVVADSDVVMLTRRMPGRNVVSHVARRQHTRRDHALGAARPAQGHRPSADPLCPPSSKPSPALDRPLRLAPAFIVGRRTLSILPAQVLVEGRDASTSNDRVQTGLARRSW